MMENKSYRIAVIPGDGTGPEVVAEGLTSKPLSDSVTLVAGRVGERGSGGGAA